MANPVIHFEVTGSDGEKLKSYYSELFGWQINSDNPMNYGTIGDGQGKGPDGEGIGGGIATAPEGSGGYVTFYVQVPSVEEALAKAESLGGTRMMGPETVMQDLVIGLFTDPQGHLMGVLSGSGSWT